MATPTVTRELAISMLAGAYAIINSKRFEGATFVHDFRGGVLSTVKISYGDAANHLISAAMDALGEGCAE